MLVGYRKIHEPILKWNWVPGEIIYIQSDTSLYYPWKVKFTNNEHSSLLVVPEKAFVLIEGIDYINRHAKLQMGIIFKGEIDAEQLLHEALDYAFNKLKLNRIYGYLMLDNRGGREILVSKGFTNEGCIPKELYWDNKIRDREIWSILKKEWVKSI